MTALSPPSHRVAVEGELTANVGGLSTRLAATGTTITWTVSDLAPAVRDLPAVGRAALGRLGVVLMAAGLTGRVVDDRGPLLEMGNVRRSLLGRFLFGSSRVRLRRLPAWLLIASRRH